MNTRERLFFRGLEMAVKCGEYVKKKREGRMSEADASLFRSCTSRLNGFVEALCLVGVFSENNTEVLYAVSRGKEDLEWIQKLEEFEHGMLQELEQKFAKEIEPPPSWLTSFLDELSGLDELGSNTAIT